jgi:hypothetical protein
VTVAKPVAIAIATVAFWSVGPSLFQPAFEGLSAASAYAIIATWVTTAFAALVPQREWRGVPITIVVYVLAFCAAAGAGYEGFYREIGDVPWSARIGIAVAQGLLVASPLVFAWSFDAFRDRFRRWASKSTAQV